MSLFKIQISLIIMFCVAGLLSLPAQSINDPYGAIHKDSSLIIRWAQNCSVTRGLINISDSSKTDHESNYASLGSASDAIGIADGKVVSLGDRGSATYTLNEPLSDGQGPEFAVFENGFKEQMSPYLWFLELAVVEVSSDGNNYYRFPAVSNIQTSTQVGTFGQSDPAEIFNLAGKYPVLYGTPFDLANMAGIDGLDIMSITHIRIIDVVGSINSQYGTTDSNGNLINDPWPTPFWSGGFDLDAVAILGQSTMEVRSSKLDARISVYPNPVTAGEPVNIIVSNLIPSQQSQLKILDISGKTLRTSIFDFRTSNFELRTSSFPPGLYFVVIENSESKKTVRLIVQ